MLDTPGFVDDRSDRENLHPNLQSYNDSQYDSHRSSNISGIIYCHNINQGRLRGPASNPMCIFQELGQDKSMKNVILCTTHWDIVVDKNFCNHSFQELKRGHWNKVLDCGARSACHDNSSKSVEKIIGLIIRKEAVNLVLLEELGRPEMTAEGKVAFKQNYEGTKQLLQDIRSTQLEEAGNRAEKNKDDEEYRLKKKLANMSAELDKLKATEEKEVIERRIKK